MKNSIIEVKATKKNQKSSYTYSKEVLSASIDEFGNITLSYAKGEYSGEYGDLEQTVRYEIKMGAVDGEPINMDLTKAASVSGRTYSIRKAAKAAGMVYSEAAEAWIRKDHPLNIKTDYSAEELSAMSDSRLREIHEASYTKYSLQRGKTLGEIASVLNKNKDKQISREVMIKAITSSI